MSDDLRAAVRGLMGRARDDLAELVSFKSVADPKLYPPSECRRGRPVARRGVQRGRASRTWRCPKPRTGAWPCTGTPQDRTAHERFCCTATTTCSRRWARTNWHTPVFELTEQGRTLVRPRFSRLQRQHRDAPDRAAGTQAGLRRFPLRHQAGRRRVRGAGHRRPGRVRPRQSRAVSSRHDPRVRHRQLRPGGTDPDDHPARYDQRRSAVASTRQSDAFRDVRRPGARPGRRTRRHPRLATRRRRQHHH